MFRYLPLIFKNALRNKRRSLLTIGSVAISLCLLGLLGAIYNAFYFTDATPEQALRLVTRNRISLATVLPLAYQQKIQTVPGVREVMVNQWFGGVYKEPKNLFARIAIEPDKLFRLFPEYQVPDDQKKAFQKEPSACMVGRGLADRYGFKLGDRITLRGDYFPINPEFTVRAIYDSAQNNAILYFNVQYLWDGMPVNRRAFAGSYYIMVDKPESVGPVSQQIDDMFRNSTVQTRTETEQAFQLGFLAFLGNVKVFLMSICAAVTFTILLVSANTMAMSVRERIREVGILKTLGFTNSAILGMILGEAALISLIGGVLGCLIANVLTYGVRHSPQLFSQLKTLTLVPSVAAVILVIGIFIGVLSSPNSRLERIKNEYHGFVAVRRLNDMAIPIAYNIRNLSVRKTTTLMTALGIALTVAVLLAVLALVEGLRTAFASTGNPLEILVLRKGSTSELSSNLTRLAFQDLKFKPGIARDKNGEPLASLEMITVINLESVDNPSGMNVTVRGVAPVGREMRDNLKIETGRWFEPGRREIVVGKSITKRYPAAKLGGNLRFGRGDWEVVGVISAGDSAVNSEIWADLNQLSGDYNRSDTLSSVLVRASDPVAAAALINDLKADQRLNMDAISEKEYYESQTNSAAPIQFLGIFVSIIMMVGSCFAAMNTMYAAVARRGKEIGTLRVLGFSRGGILLSFFLESVILSILGGILGCLLVLPLNNITTGIGSFVTFSETAFQIRVTPAIMLIGVVFALLMGAMGGFFPARSAARKEILVALREN